MGAYVNPGNKAFSRDRKKDLYVDKSGLIKLTNIAMEVQNGRIVVSRPRRFGKTMAISMLKAYYSCGCDSYNLFRGLEIENDPSFERHLNKYNVIHMDIQGLYLRAKGRKRMDDFPCYISETINAELGKLYPDEVRGNEKYLTESITSIGAVHDMDFIFLLDEWDVIYRDEKNKKIRKEFTDFLKGLFKDSNASDYIDLVYMTGILPIPKQETQSGLNNFEEYTMLTPDMFAEYIGFTESEVTSLCNQFQMPLQELKDWYEGYQFNSVGSVYCPSSVVTALERHVVRNYWKKTATATDLFNMVNSINPEFQKAVRDLLLGIPVPLKPDTEGLDLSDLTNLRTALTALVHLGYLAYQDRTVRIPNLEVAAEFFDTLSRANKSPAYEIMARSKDLLEKTLSGDANEVARILEENHDTYASVLSYNQESNLACIVVLSYKGSVEDDYTLIRELPSGKGFADIVFLPRIPGRIPVIIELKWNESADTAIRQIKGRRYTGRVHGFPAALLVGISYDKDQKSPSYKKHTCVIEHVDNP